MRLSLSLLPLLRLGRSGDMQRCLLGRGEAAEMEALAVAPYASLVRPRGPASAPPPPPAPRPPPLKSTAVGPRQPAPRASSRHEAPPPRPWQSSRRRTSCRHATPMPGTASPCTQFVQSRCGTRSGRLSGPASAPPPPPAPTPPPLSSAGAGPRGLPPRASWQHAELPPRPWRRSRGRRSYRRATPLPDTASYDLAPLHCLLQHCRRRGPASAPPPPPAPAPPPLSSAGTWPRQPAPQVFWRRAAPPPRPWRSVHCAPPRARRAPPSCTRGRRGRPTQKDDNLDARRA
eukprot:scaffold54331_cov70-Phaeocystis_antarctica.AAC.4